MLKVSSYRSGEGRHITYSLGEYSDSQASELTETASFSGSALLFDWFCLRISAILQVRQEGACATF